MGTKFLLEFTSKCTSMSRNTRSKIALQEQKNKDPNAGVFIDTSGHVSKTLHMDWSRIYSIFDNDEFSPISHDQAAYAKIRSSHIHCIASRPLFMPYTDPVKWELDYTISKELSFDNHLWNLVASFHPDVFAKAYALGPPQWLLMVQFLDAAVTQFDYEEVIKS